MINREYKYMVESIIWSLARIAQELFNRSIWFFEKDVGFARKIINEHRDWRRDEAGED